MNNKGFIALNGLMGQDELKQQVVSLHRLADRLITFSVIKKLKTRVDRGIEIIL